MKSIQFPSVAPYLINSCLYVQTLRDTLKNHATSARYCLPEGYRNICKNDCVGLFKILNIRFGSVHYVIEIHSSFKITG